MDIKHKVDLEGMLLDQSAEPTYLPLSLLEDITNCFSDDHEIGSGGFAVVYKGLVGKGMVAVKKLYKTFGMNEDKFPTEVECLMMAKHKNIVRFLGYCSDMQGRIRNHKGKFVMADLRNWLLCFEYIPNGSLDKYITDASCGLEWRERYKIIKGICEGLLHLHEKHILHLDLKPGNILVDNHMVPKITDFGLSRCLDIEQTGVSTLNTCGSLGYLAPESFGGKLTFASDIYSLGVIIVEILTGEKGYPEDEDVVETWKNRLAGIDQWETQLEQIRLCIKIGMECRESNPKKRPVIRHINSSLDKIPSTIDTYITRSSSRNYLRYGGLTLEKIKSMKLFRKEQIKPVLKDENFVSKNVFGEVYSGIVDNVLVTVRKLISGTVLENGDFANEVIIQSQVTHNNILRLIGCCLEFDVPVLVYEFYSKVSLQEILHGKNRNDLGLYTLFRIATEAAAGIAYMHSSSVGILHGDLKPTDILLDEDSFSPEIKISGFGMSRISKRDIIDHTAYMDPVYLEKGLLVETSDVYSFGVIMLELLSGRKATHADNNRFVRKFLSDRKFEYSAELDYDGPEILEVLGDLLQIVVDCLNHHVDLRPTMEDVARRLGEAKEHYLDLEVHNE